MTGDKAEPARLRQAVNKLDRGLIILNHAGHPSFITSRARRWLDKYFGNHQPRKGLHRAFQKLLRDENALPARRNGKPVRRMVAEEGGR